MEAQKWKKIREHDMDFVAFQIGDDPQVYKLHYDYNRLCDAEAETEMNLFAPFEGVRAMTCSAFRAILYACLKTAHPGVSIEEAGGLVSQDRELLYEAVGTVIAKVRVEEPEPKPEPTAPGATATETAT